MNHTPTLHGIPCVENEHRAAEFGREGRLVNLNQVLILEFLLPCQWILLIHFRYGPNTCSHYTKVWHSTHLMCDAPLSTLEKCSFHPLQKSCGEKAFRYSLQWWTTP